MSSGKPLLSPSEPSSVVRHHPSPCSLGSVSSYCQNVSISSSATEEDESNYLDQKKDREEEVAAASVVGGTGFSLAPFEQVYLRPNKKKSQSAELYIPRQFSLVHPTRERRYFVSWGTMELHSTAHPPSSYEISVLGEKFHKSHGVQSRFVIFKDNLVCEENARMVYINESWKMNDKYELTGNEIRTSKYTFITFFPKNLFIHFHPVAYLYFLAIAALNQLPPLAVFGRTVSLFPLLFVLCVTAIKDGYEDWRRHRSDRNENNREALVLQDGEFRMKKWKKIRAGEVVKIHADESIPCDMVLLCTSDPHGLAYIQTMNLDG